MQDRDLKVERINTRAATIPFVIPKETSREAYTTLPTPSGSTIKVKPDSMTAEPQGAFSLIFMPCKEGSPHLTAMIMSHQGGGAVQIGALSGKCAYFPSVCITANNASTPRTLNLNLNHRVVLHR